MKAEHDLFADLELRSKTVGQRRSSQVDDARRARGAAGDAKLGDADGGARRLCRLVRSRGGEARRFQIALAGTQQEALVGSRTVLDVLISEQQLFTTQSQLVGAQHVTLRWRNSISRRRLAG